MVSEHGNATASNGNAAEEISSEEQLLGAPPELSDDAWGQMLNSAFEAPPGYADGIVDAFETPESADDSTDVDDHAIDFDGFGAGAGQGGSGQVGDDALIDVDAATPDDQDAADQDALQPDAAETSADSDDSGSDAEFGFGIDTLMSTESSPDEDFSDDLGIDPDDSFGDEDFGAGDYSA